MTDYYAIPTGYPTASDWTPTKYEAASIWASRWNLSGGTAGQTLYAYEMYGSGQPPYEWRWSPGQTPSTYEPPTVNTSYSTGCFIATAAYGADMGKDLDTLRAFRDGYLPDELVKLYYHCSPSIAKAISHHNTLRWIIRQPLKVIARCLNLIGIG